MELIDVQKVWARAPHNAFPDLLRFRGAWIMALREAETHVSDDGKIRILSSVDTRTWSDMALIGSNRGDVRDADLSITPSGQLMLSSAIRLVPPEGEHYHQSANWFSDDGRIWSAPALCSTGLGTWRWSVTWHNGIAYSFGYSGKDLYGCFYCSEDGKEWTVVVDAVFPKECYANETSLVFDEEDTAYCLLRRDPEGCHACLGIARPPYDNWRWHELNARIGGPEMIRYAAGTLIAAVRLYGEEDCRTSVCTIDPEHFTITEQLALPSGGDTSYPGLAVDGEDLLAAYYSSHEDSTAVYLARIRV